MITPALDNQPPRDHRRLRTAFIEHNTDPSPDDVQAAITKLTASSPGDSTHRMHGLSPGTFEGQTEPGRVFKGIAAQNAAARVTLRTVELEFRQLSRGDSDVQIATMTSYIEQANFKNLTTHHMMQLFIKAFDLDSLDLMHKILAEAKKAEAHAFCNNPLVRQRLASALNRHGYFYKVIEMAPALCPSHPSITDEPAGAMGRARRGAFKVAEVFYLYHKENAIDADTFIRLIQAYEKARGPKEARKVDIRLGVPINDAINILTDSVKTTRNDYTKSTAVAKLYTYYHHNKHALTEHHNLIQAYERACGPEEARKVDIRHGVPITEANNAIRSNMLINLNEAIAWNEAGFQCFFSHYLATELTKCYVYRATLTENSREERKLWLTKARKLAQMAILITEHDNVKESTDLWLNTSWYQAQLIESLTNNVSTEVSTEQQDHHSSTTLDPKKMLEKFGWAIHTTEYQQNVILSALRSLEKTFRQIDLGSMATTTLKEAIATLEAFFKTPPSPEKKKELAAAFQNLEPSLTKSTLLKKLRQHTWDCSLHDVTRNAHAGVGGTIPLGGDFPELSYSSTDWLEMLRLARIPIKDLISSENIAALPSGIQTRTDLRICDIENIDDALGVLHVLYRQIYEITKEREVCNSAAHKNAMLTLQAMLELSAASKRDVRESAEMSAALDMSLGLSPDCRALNAGPASILAARQQHLDQILLRAMLANEGDHLPEELVHQFKTANDIELRYGNFQVHDEHPILPGTSFIENHVPGILLHNHDPSIVLEIKENYYLETLTWLNPKLGRDDITFDKHVVPQLHMKANLTESNRKVSLRLAPNPFPRLNATSSRDHAGNPLCYGLPAERDYISPTTIITAAGKHTIRPSTAAIREAYIAYTGAKPPIENAIDGALKKKNYEGIESSDLVRRSLTILYFNNKEYVGYELYFAAKDYVAEILRARQRCCLVTKEMKQEIVARLMEEANDKIINATTKSFRGVAKVERVLDILKSLPDPLGIKEMLIRAIPSKATLHQALNSLRAEHASEPQKKMQHTR